MRTAVRTKVRPTAAGAYVASHVLVIVENGGEHTVVSEPTPVAIWLVTDPRTTLSPVGDQEQWTHRPQSGSLWCRPQSAPFNLPTADGLFSEQRLCPAGTPPRDEKHAIPMKPRGESAKADFAVSGATSVAGRARPIGNTLLSRQAETQYTRWGALTLPRPETQNEVVRSRVCPALAAS